MAEVNNPTVGGSAAPNRTKRNVILLAICQALAQTGSSLTATVAALAGFLIAQDKSLATLPMAFQFLGTMLSTIPASFFMRRFGRRVGFTVGMCFGLAGAGLSVYALFSINFPLLVFGALLLGIHNAFWQYYRFAATDTASEEYRSRVISYVLAGGVVAAFVGPQLATVSIDLFEPVKFAGGYAAIMAIILVSMCVMQFVQIPRPSAEERSRSGRPLLEIISQPKFVVALMSSMFGYAAMILMMTATPLAMQFCGHGFGDTAFVIQWHMVGMFAPSFFTGYTIKRFGVLNVITVGIILMFGSAAIGFSGIAVTQFWWALFLLGVGWNFMFIGGTTLVVESYRAEERAKVQAFHDFMVFTFVAIASFSSGSIQHLWGWGWINTAMVIPMAVVLLATAWLRLYNRRAATAG
ncbi:MAG: MFS transporter [Pseudomonadota bacterium]|nr:MFS transporter [Pseudomonadota bacterium]